MSVEIARFRDITEYSTNAMIFSSKIIPAPPLRLAPILDAKVLKEMEKEEKSFNYLLVLHFYRIFAA